MNKWTVLSAYMRAKLLERRLRSRGQLERWQQRKLEQFLPDVVRRSAFYRSLYGGLRMEDWRSWPLMDKKQFMTHFDELNTVGIRRDEAFELAAKAEQTRDFSPMIGRIAVGLSSGTSGNRGVFLVSAEERAAWAGAILAKVLPDPLYMRQKVAFFLRANSNLYESVRSRTLQFYYFDLLDEMCHHVVRLQELQPTLVVAPPSMLRLLADAAGQGKLSIRPRKIISVAEVLEPLDRRYIGDAFGLPVHQVYQCTEGFLAATCPHGTLHINEDLLVVQPDYIDGERQRFMPVITDFSRTSQPIIRYRLNDILTLRDSPCPCGSVYRALGSVEGRMDDLFYGRRAGQRELVAIFPDFIRRAAMLASGDIAEYMVTQLAPHELEVAVTVDAAVGSGAHVPDDMADSVRQRLAEAFVRHGCEAPQVRFVPYTPPQPGVAKLRRVKRSFAVDERRRQP